MVFYNNLLSVVLLLPMCLYQNELVVLFSPELSSVRFWGSAVVAGLTGFYLNFASLWCVSATSATTYAIVGSLNKVPITVLGFLFFHAKMTTEGVWFVVMATFGGFVYAYSKLPK
jgi:GDP-mannose transporter